MCASDNSKSTLYEVKYKYKVKSPCALVQMKTLPPGCVQTQNTDVGVIDKLHGIKLAFRIPPPVSTET